MQTYSGNPPFGARTADRRFTAPPLGRPRQRTLPYIAPSSSPGAPAAPAQQQAGQLQHYSVQRYSAQPFVHSTPPWTGDLGFPRLDLPVLQRGAPTFFAFAAVLAAAAVALLCDVVFLRVHVPGVGGYAWYLTTALSFMAASFGGARFTRTGRAAATTAVILGGLLYGAADVALGSFVESLTLNSALVLGAQGLAIAVFTGFTGMYRGFAARP